MAECWMPLDCPRPEVHLQFDIKDSNLASLVRHTGEQGEEARHKRFDKQMSSGERREVAEMGN
jgi:hypothetical protein